MTGAQRLQLAYGLPGQRIDPVGGDLGQGIEHEGALAKAWMRDDELGLVNHGVAEQNQIEVQRSWRAGVRPLSAEGTLDAEEVRQEGTRRERRFPGDGSVQEPRLRGYSDGIRVVECRPAQVGECVRERPKRVFQPALAIAEVAAEGDGDARAWSRSIPSSGSAGPRPAAGRRSSGGRANLPRRPRPVRRSAGARATHRE